MIYEQIIHGLHVDIRSAIAEDAERTLELRKDSKKTRFLHPLENDVEKQRQWIQKQMEKEGDYFFVVLDKFSKMIGTIGLYDIKGKRGHTGRLLSYGNAFQSFEIQLLTERFAFEYLKLEELLADVDERNTATLKFCEVFGYQFEEPVYDSDMNRQVKYGLLYRDNYETYAEKIEQFVYRRNKKKPTLPWQKKM